MSTRVSLTRATMRLPANVVALGCASLLMAMSSQMIHSLLPVFLIGVLRASAVSVGLIEVIAEATNSLSKVISGVFSDWLGRRKPLVVLGHTLAALSKPLFPIAADVGTVLLAGFFDRSGKGIRDTPRDALLADQLSSTERGSGFGLRLTLFTLGSMVGPLAAASIMLSSGGDMRLVFWVAVIPAFLSVAVLVAAAKDSANGGDHSTAKVSLRESRDLPALFWWTVTITGVLELSRFSRAFLALKAKDVRVGCSRRSESTQTTFTDIKGATCACVPTLCLAPLQKSVKKLAYAPFAPSAPPPSATPEQRCASPQGRRALERLVPETNYVLSTRSVLRA